MDRNVESHQIARRGLSAILGIAVLAGLYASSLYSYLFFHSLVELFSIVTAFVIFVIDWHTRRIQDNHNLATSYSRLISRAGTGPAVGQWRQNLCRRRGR
ncbi:MAG: MASE3 domain-containing protein [Betaproteobacteria bacterium]